MNEACRFALVTERVRRSSKYHGTYASLKVKQPENEDSEWDYSVSGMCMIMKRCVRFFLR
jgi:hypothetical protein